MRRLHLLPLFARSVVFRALVLVLLSFYACKDEGTPPPPYVSTVQLSVEDVSCTEAWLKVSLTDSAEPRTVAIVQDGQRVAISSLPSPDSIFVFEGLLPRRTYTFLAQRLRDSTVIDASAPAQAATMDTTSHNFTWQMDTLGATASVLYDVAIINDTLAYAVGEMYLRDSTGQLDPMLYNMAKWNGSVWKLIRIQFYTICGQSTRTPYPTSSVFAFDATDLWVTSRGGQLAHWDGTTQTATICNPDPFAVNKIWGGNRNSIWAVGYGGRIGHYVSGTWQRVESGTQIEISDVYGALNRKTNSWDVIAVAGNPYVGPQRKILQVNGAGVTALSDSGIDRALSGIWFAPGKRVWVVGDGIWYSNYLQSGFSWNNKSGTWTQFALTKIRGNDVNDVCTVGSYSEVLHFNGATVRSFRGATGTDGLYWSVAMKGDRIMAVGQVPPHAVVLRGVRVP